ncbi:MAG: cytochrome c [Roseiflexaceae bacterium]
MMKFSIVLAVIGLAFLLLSAVPMRSAVFVIQAPATAAPSTPAAGTAVADEIAYGKALFLAKGCATCHRHAAVASSGFGPGSDIPDLTTARWSADYLRTWLKDPAAVKPATNMPNLGLKRAEIEALIAFLNTSE